MSQYKTVRTLTAFYIWIQKRPDIYFINSLALLEAKFNSLAHRLEILGFSPNPAIGLARASLSWTENICDQQQFITANLSV